MQNNAAENNYANILSQAGLSDKESIIYETLLDKGQLGIGQLLELIEFKRGDLYNHLYSLRDKQIIEQTIKNGKIQFKARDPYKLLDYLDQQKQQYLESYSQVQAIMPGLLDKFNFQNSRPSIYHKEGIEGLKDVYELIYRSGKKEVLLFRSIYDSENDEVTKVLKSHRKKQAEHGIKVKAITPWTEKALENYLTTDKDLLFERRFVNKNKFTLPAEIMIWGNNVSLISRKNGLVVTVIENKDIAQTIKIIFNLLWDSLESHHNKLVEKIITDLEIE